MAFIGKEWLISYIEVWFNSVKFYHLSFLILSPDGATWTAGINDHGQLSLHTVDRSPIFTKVQGVPPAKQIATGHSHCVVLAENGEVNIVVLGHRGLGLIKPHLPNPLSEIILIMEKDLLDHIQIGEDSCCETYDF